MKSCTIIGGGIIGLAVAAKLLRSRPGLRLTLLEKEDGLARHQSGHNSGVLHAGLYYKTGSAKARLAVSGIKQMTTYCRSRAISHEICGKIVVATTEEEIPRLRTLLERGTANGLKGLAWLTPEQIREREPHAAGIAAVLVPEEGIVDYTAVCQALTADIKTAGGEIRVGFPVVRLQRTGNLWSIKSEKEEIETEFLINCGGLHCDRISTMAGIRPSSRIVPFRGDYYKIRQDREKLVRHLIYPVPEPSFPFLGVHFTRLIHGGVEAGPNAVLALKREGYSRGSFSWRDATDTLTFPGFWRFAAHHAQMCFHEWRRSVSKTLFCRALQRLVPDLREEDLEPGGSGVRAQAMTRQGYLQDDFAVHQDLHSLHLLNAPSPGATASLAVADDLLARLNFVAHPL